MGVLKYDKKAKRWYREVNGKRTETLRLGTAYKTNEGLFLFNSDGTRTKLNPKTNKTGNRAVLDSKPKPKPAAKPQSSSSQYNYFPNNSYFKQLLDFITGADLLGGTKIPFKHDPKALLELDRRQQAVKKWEAEYRKPKRLEAKDVKTWEDRKRYEKQLLDDNDAWLNLRDEEYSRKLDQYSLKKGYKIKLVEKEDMWGNPTKKYYFYNPKTGELGNKVSKFYAKDHGLNMTGVTPHVYSRLEDNNIYNQAKRDHTALLKQATKNIEGPKSSELANAVTGGAFNLLSPTNVYGGIVGGIRKGQTFGGAAMNTLFGFDSVNPEKSGNKGILETTHGMAKWADKHPYATMAINAVGDMAAGRLIHGIGTGEFASSAAGNATGKGVNYVLGKTGLATNWVKDLGTNSIKQGVQATKQAIKSAPGGTKMATFGRGALNTGKSAVSSLKGYGTRALQYIPLGTRDWASSAARGTRNFFGRFKGVNMFNRGLRGVTGYRLTPNAKTGFKTLATLYGIGQGYLNGKDKSSSIIPVILPKSLDRAYSLYNKANTAVDTYNTAMDMYDWDDYSTENLYNTGQGIIDIFG